MISIALDFLRKLTEAEKELKTNSKAATQKKILDLDHLQILGCLDKT